MCHMKQLKLIGASDAARILGVTRAHVNRLVATGKINPAARLGKRGVNVFDQLEIEALASRGVRNGQDR